MTAVSNNIISDGKYMSDLGSVGWNNSSKKWMDQIEDQYKKLGKEIRLMKKYMDSIKE